MTRRLSNRLSIHHILLLAMIAGFAFLVAACSMAPYRPATDDPQGPVHGDSGGAGGGGGSM